MIAGRTNETTHPSHHAMVLYFLKLGAIGFGGPIVLCEHMRRDLVEARGWISPEGYTEGFALSQLAPGPLAAQLAIYLGWVRGNVLWATLVGIAFVLPSLLMVFGLAILYMKFGGFSLKFSSAFTRAGTLISTLISTLMIPICRCEPHVP